MSDQLSEVRDGYDRWAEVYDDDLNPLVALEGPVVREAAGGVEGLDALDLGCGTGRHALWLAQADARVTAVDFSEGMLAAARRKPGAERVRFVAHDLHEPLPYRAEFDVVVSALVLEHLRDLDAFFRQAYDALRPGGRAIVSGMHPAMFLRGSHARFTDPGSGEVVSVGSVCQPIGDVVMAAVRAGFVLKEIVERAPDEAFARQWPRAEKYVDWPMLVVFTLSRPGPG